MSRKIFTTFLVHVMVTIVMVAMVSCSSDHMKSAINYLTEKMKTYDSKILPSLYGEPVDVIVGLEIENMVPYKRKDKHYTVEMFFRTSWNDFRLNYTSVIPSNVSDNFNVSMPPKFGFSLWRPGLYLDPGREGGVQTALQPNILTNIMPNGTVKMSERIILVVSCNMDFDRFPFDQNECDLFIQTYAYSTDYVRLEWAQPVDMPKNRDMLEYHLEELSYGKKIFVYAKTYGWDGLYVTFIFDRNLNYHILQTFLPLHMNVVLSWIGFWIDFHCTPARVSLAVTSVLTMVTLVGNIRNNLPSHEITSLEWYITVCLMYVFLALVEFTVVCLTNLKWTDNTKKEELPTNRLRKISRAVFGSMSQRRNFKTSNSGNAHEISGNAHEISGETSTKNNVRNRSKKKREGSSFSETKRQMSDKFLSFHERRKHEVHVIDLISRYIFPISFIIIDVIYFTFYVYAPMKTN